MRGHFSVMPHPFCVSAEQSRGVPFCSRSSSQDLKGCAAVALLVTLSKRRGDAIGLQASYTVCSFHTDRTDTFICTLGLVEAVMGG